MWRDKRFIAVVAAGLLALALLSILDARGASLPKPPDVMNSNPMTPDEPDKSAFADEPFAGGDKNLNGAQNLFDRMDTGPIGERHEEISEMVGNLFDRLGEE